MAALALDHVRALARVPEGEVVSARRGARRRRAPPPAAKSSPGAADEQVGAAPGGEVVVARAAVEREGERLGRVALRADLVVARGRVERQRVAGVGADDRGERGQAEDEGGRAEVREAREVAAGRAGDRDLVGVAVRAEVDLHAFEDGVAQVAERDGVLAGARADHDRVHGGVREPGVAAADLDAEVLAAQGEADGVRAVRALDGERGAGELGRDAVGLVGVCGGSSREHGEHGEAGRRGSASLHWVLLGERSGRGRTGRAVYSSPAA